MSAFLLKRGGNTLGEGFGGGFCKPPPRKTRRWFFNILIESAHKYCIQSRLKQAGMRWSIKNANAVAQLRSSYISEIGTTFGKRLRSHKTASHPGHTI